MNYWKLHPFKNTNVTYFSNNHHFSNDSRVYSIKKIKSQKEKKKILFYFHSINRTWEELDFPNFQILRMFSRSFSFTRMQIRKREIEAQRVIKSCSPILSFRVSCRSKQSRKFFEKAALDLDP